MVVGGGRIKATLYVTGNVENPSLHSPSKQNSDDGYCRLHVLPYFKLVVLITTTKLDMH